MLTTIASSLYPSNWPKIPFHKGEVQVQKLLGSHDNVMSYAPRMVRPFMPDQHREFFAAQPFLVVAARDREGRLWSTFLASSGEMPLTTSPDPQTLLIRAMPVPGDALEGALSEPGTDLGIIGIEFATKRRNRVNGRIMKSTESTSSNKMIEFKVDQGFGNCPQYIKPRQWWTASDDTEYDSCQVTHKNRQHPNHLSEEQMVKIRKAETIFLASGYRESNQEDPRYGNDASHRGGPAGFVHIKDNRTLILPDFSGNNHYNTIGNLIMDNRIGISFPEYETGGMLQVTGRASINFEYETASSFYPGAERLIEIHIDRVNELPPGSIPIRWTTNMEELQERLLVVSAKIQESNDVVSLHLRPRDQDLQTLWKFLPGQHLPILLSGVDPLNQEAVVERTYSISAGTDWGEYRVSVKRQGLASNFLHDKIQVGDVLRVLKPAGDFVWLATNRPVLLLSNGIGITPLLSMLHSWAAEGMVQTNPTASANHPVYWVHGARNSQHHPFRAELAELQSILDAKAPLTTHIAYSQPLEGDEYDSSGRLSVERLGDFVPNLCSVEVYMCGSDAFVADMEEGLSRAGVPSSQIHYETF